MNKKMVHAILCAVINAADRMAEKGRDIVTEGADREELVRIYGEIDGLLQAHRIILNALGKEEK